MRKCIRCDVEMLEDYDVKVEGGAYGLKITKPGIFKDNLGKVHASVCPECGYLEFYLEDTAKIKKQTNFSLPVRLKARMNLNFTLLLPVNQAVQLDLTGLLKGVDRLIDMVGSVFRTKVIRYFHQVIQGGNIDEERYYL